MEQLDTPIRNDSSLTSDWESGNSTGSLYDVPPSVVILLSFFYGLISLMAFIGNALVIYVVVVAPRMRTVTNYYIANLAIADVTIALFAIPFQFHAALLQRWDLPEFMCQFCPTVQILSVNVSIFTLVAISMDRYRAIMYPLRKKPSKLFSNIVILCIWILSLTFALPLGLFHTFGHVPDPQSPNGEKPFCYIDFGNTTSNATMTTFKYYSFSLVTVEYFVPLAIITFAYSRISYRLWGTKTPGTAQDERDHNILQNKKKVIKMLVVVVSIFAFCWMPWQIYATTMLTIPEVNSYRYINIIFFVCHWLAMSNSCYNPFIYGVYSVSTKGQPGAYWIIPYILEGSTNYVITFEAGKRGKKGGMKGVLGNFLNKRLSKEPQNLSHIRKGLSGIFALLLQTRPSLTNIVLNETANDFCQ